MNSAPRTVRLALAQLNPTVGDLSSNTAMAARAIEQAREARAELVLMPELVITGYPAEDLLLQPHFCSAARACVEELARSTQGIVALVGFPEHDGHVFNSAAVLAQGAIAGIYRKNRLPNYGVFDERRYFRPGTGGAILELGDVRVGITICEDMWEPGAPASEESASGASLLVNLSASPYHARKGLDREAMFAARALENGAAVAYCNLVGGQDELVFDGHSLVLDHEGAVIARGAQFEEDLVLCDVALPPRPGADTASEIRPGVERIATLTRDARPNGDKLAGALPDLLSPDAEIYAALVCGLRDYASKNGFGHVVLGLSGGIDSALVAAIAVDALGAQRVSVATMPSPYSSTETRRDAHEFAHGLGLTPLEIDISPAMDAYGRTLKTAFAGREPDLTEENLQARIRGNLLMALSNKFGWLVLTTGNKSEMSVGYSTLYGDSAGGFAVIKDCPKTLVYRLARYRNTLAPEPVIPESIIDRAPSAELRPEQRDDDSLPPYELLDPILEAYVENDLGRDAIAETLGVEVDEIDRIIALVDHAEYKRRQNPPGIKITPRAFGRDRRLPITNRFGA